MPFVKWDDPYLCGFKVLKLNQRLCLDHTDPDTQGFIVFRSYLRTVKYVAPFSFRDLLVHPSSGSFAPAFFSALLSSTLFWPDPDILDQISMDITNFLHLFYSFSHETLFDLTSPTLVFVLDFFYYPCLFPGCFDYCHLKNDPTNVCYAVTSFRTQPKLLLHGFEECVFLGTRSTYQYRDVFGEEVDIITQLREFCGVGSVPWINIRLMEVEGPQLLTLEEEVAEMCPLCGEGFEQWEDSVLIHACGHVSHTGCALPVLDLKCFVCGLGEVTML